jgi:hypothetical protein
VSKRYSVVEIGSITTLIPIIIDPVVLWRSSFVLGSNYGNLSTGIPTMIDTSSTRKYNSATLIPTMIGPIALLYFLVELGSIIVGISVWDQ